MQLVTVDVPADVTVDAAQGPTPDIEKSVAAGLETGAEVQPLSVSDYASQLGSALRKVGGAVLEGEVQEPSKPGRSGMFFFDLTDGKSVLSCKVFRHAAKRLKHQPKHGDLVRVTVDRPDLYNGNLNLVVSSIELAGVGALLRKREELLKRLTAEGLTDADRWKPRPWLPNTVGVIAGRDSKGMTDVTRALAERFPPVSILTCPALVQGLKAPRDLIDALAYLEQDPRVEAIILARGGGSVQDLVAFDDEGLCRAVFACSTPVIAAVGHTDNIPVVNHITWSATTPSRAPEMAVPAAQELRLQLTASRRVLAVVPERLGISAERVGECAERIEVTSQLEAEAGTVREVGSSLGLAEERTFGLRERSLEQVRAVLGKIPLQLPRPERLAEARAHLDAAVRSLFRDRASEVERQAEVLFGPGLLTLDRVLEEVQEQGGRIEAGTWRELADHERDYGRATQQLAREMRRLVERDFDDYKRELEHQREALFAPGLQALTRLEEGVVDRGGRIEAGTMRELADHERDYGRATQRLAREMRQLVERDLEGYHRELERQRALFDSGLHTLASLEEEVQQRGGRIEVGARRELAAFEKDYGQAAQRLAREVQQLAGRELDDYCRELQRHGVLFDAGPHTLASLEEEIGEQGARVERGARRELATFEKDYGQAAQRLARQMRQVAERDLGEYRRELDRLGKIVGTSVDTNFRLARRNADHLAALIKAHDQRSRGWVLPQDEQGTLIKFPPGAPVGQRFSLNFREGRQWVVAESIELEEGSR